MRRKKGTPVIDSRHLKILSAKKELLNNSVVLVYFDDDKFHGSSVRRKIIEKIDAIAPNGNYFPLSDGVEIHFYDKAEFKNKDVLVTIFKDDGDDRSTEKLVSKLKSILPGVKSVSVVCANLSMEIK